MRILHVGDHDPSGQSIYESLKADVGEIISDLPDMSENHWPHREKQTDFAFERVAVTPAQIAQYNLPTAPAKKTDNRAFTGQTCQAESLLPDLLQEIVRDAALQHYDPQVDLDNEAAEAAEVAKFNKWVDTLPDFPALPDLPPFEG